VGILITLPDLRRGGGVAHFYDRIAPYLPADTRLLVVGKRLGEDGAPSAAARLVKDTAEVRRALDADDAGVLIVNPSLDSRSLLRDGLAVRAARARGRRVIVFVRGWQDETERLIDGPLGRAFAAAFLEADAFIVLAAKFRRALRRWGYRGPVHTATTAVTDDALCAVDEAAIAERCRRGGALNVLFLSRVRADKGVYEALAAVRIAQRAGLALRASVAGDGPDLPRVARWVNERGVGRVRFLGDVRGEEKARLMLDSDLYLFPTSHGEGMPATLLEAMAYGMGVVTCSVGGVEDFFVDGEHGLLAPDAAPPTLGSRLELVARDAALRERMGCAAHRFAQREFAPRVAAERLLAVVAQVRATPAGVVAPDSDWFARHRAQAAGPEGDAP
jgi:glycosyltransferase involved in cell wall biosynthesis